MVDEPLFDTRIGREYIECSAWRKAALKKIASMRPDIVILGSTPTPSFDHAQWVDGTTRVLTAINNAVDHIYILRGTPELPFDGPNCLSSKSWLSWLPLRQSMCRAPAFNRQNNDVYLSLQQAGRRFDNVTVLDLNSAVCPRGECDAERDGKIVFRDSQHMTATFVESLSGDLGRQLNLEDPASEPAYTK